MKKIYFLLIFIIFAIGLIFTLYNSKYMQMYIYVNFLNEKSSLENYFFEDTFIPYRGSVSVSYTHLTLPTNREV